MMKVYEAIAAVMADLSIEGISKSKRNTQGAGYNFRGIDDVMNTISGLLSKHGLVIIPRVVSRENVERSSKSGGALFFTAVEVEFDLVSVEDGSKHTARTAGEAMDSSDKSTNKAMSAAYKYMAIQTFCIPTEGDNDADAHSHDVAPTRAAPKQSTVPKNDKARETFTALQADMRQCKIADDLRRWWNDTECKDLRASLPEDWQRNLRDQWIELGKEMAAKEQAKDTVSDIKDQFPGSTVRDERITDKSGRELETIEG